jgi:hypothetical protein
MDIQQKTKHGENVFEWQQSAGLIVNVGNRKERFSGRVMTTEPRITVVCLLSSWMYR